MEHGNRSPAIIFKASFEYKWHIGGYDYLEYMNRPEAFKKSRHLRDEYKDFLDYMSNTEKSDGLFDATDDLLSKEQIEAFRRHEEASQACGCPKYYGVISFRNDFLQKHGILSADGRLDIGLLKELTRDGMSELIGTSKKLNASNVYWNAAIHTNTDNIHIHYTLCEYKRLENRQAVYRNGDMLELKAFEALKSRVVNRIMGTDLSRELTSFEREILLNGIRASAPSCKEQLIKLAAALPPEGGWQYNRPKMIKYREQIDNCVAAIISSDEQLSSSFKEYIRKLDERAVLYRDEIYGSNKTQRYLDYKKNRLKDFNARSGNIVLKCIAESELQAKLIASGARSAHPSEEIKRNSPRQPTAMYYEAAEPVSEEVIDNGQSDHPSEEEMPLPEPPENISWWDASRSAHPSEEELMQYLAEQEQHPDPSDVPGRNVSSQKRVTMTLSSSEVFSQLDEEASYRHITSEQGRLRPFSSFRLAKIYTDDPDRRDLESAIRYLKDAAASEQLRPFASYRLAKIYTDDPDHRDLESAIRYLKDAAASEQLRPFASYRLAKIYLEDTDHRNEPEAISLLENISEQNSNAAYRLGWIFLRGTEQTPKDQEKSLAYLQLAASQGHKGAARLLDNISRSRSPSEQPRRRRFPLRTHIAAELQMVLRNISNDMSQEHRIAMREFEQMDYINEQRNRLY